MDEHPVSPAAHRGEELRCAEEKGPGAICTSEADKLTWRRGVQSKTPLESGVRPQWPHHCLREPISSSPLQTQCDVQHTYPRIHTHEEPRGRERTGCTALASAFPGHQCHPSRIQRVCTVAFAFHQMLKRRLFRTC